MYHLINNLTVLHFPEQKEVLGNSKCIGSLIDFLFRCRKLIINVWSVGLKSFWVNTNIFSTHDFFTNGLYLGHLSTFFIPFCIGVYNLEIRVVHAVSFYFLLVTFLNIILQIATKVCFVKLYIQLLYCIWYDTKCFEPENVIIFQLWALTIFNSTFVHARVKENQLGSFMLNNNTRAVSKQKIQ